MEVELPGMVFRSGGSTKKWKSTEQIVSIPKQADAGVPGEGRLPPGGHQSKYRGIGAQQPRRALSFLIAYPARQLS